MRRRIAASMLLILLFAAGGDAVAAVRGLKKPAQDKPPPVRATARPEAGGAQTPPVISVSRPVPPPSLGWPPSPALRRLGQDGAGLAASGLTGLRAQTDAAPLCRNQCATVRYQCLAGDQGEACDGPWSRCVLTCRTPATP